MFTIFRRAMSKNNFIVEVHDKDWTSEWATIFSKQIESVKINLVANSVQIQVRQLKSGHIQDLIFHLLSEKGRLIDEFRLKHISGNSDEYIFLQGELSHHDVEYSYNSVTPIIHTLTFRFKEITRKSIDQTMKLK